MLACLITYYIEKIFKKKNIKVLQERLDIWSANTDDQHLAHNVRNTLGGHAHHKSLARFMAKRFLSDFQGTNGWIINLSF